MRRPERAAEAKVPLGGPVHGRHPGDGLRRLVEGYGAFGAEVGALPGLRLKSVRHRQAVGRVQALFENVHIGCSLGASVVATAQVRSDTDHESHEGLIGPTRPAAMSPPGRSTPL